MAKKIVMVLGVIFILIGVLGFVNNPILGLFHVDVVHNLIHLVSGALAVFFAMKGEMQAKKFAKVFAVVYGLVAVLGFITPGDMILGFLTANMHDDVLHVVLALVFAWVGWGKTQMTSPMMGGMN